MKILLWPTMYFPNIGGLEKVVHSLALSLLDKGHEVLVIANAETIATFSIEEIPVFTFPFINALFSYRLQLVGQILKQVSELVDSFSPDVINVHGWFECFSFYQVRILKKKSIPVSLTIHGLLEQKSYQTENCLELWQRAQSISTVSDAISPSLPHPCLQTIYNGLPLSKTPLQPLPKNRLLLIGRLTEEKCFHIAFYAFKLLRTQYFDLHLTLLGDGPDYETLFNLKESLHLPIDMPGFMLPHEIEGFIDQSSLVLIPSAYESFSMVALEAALRGRPVVASNVLGLKEVIDDQKTGLLVEPKDSTALAQAVSSLLLDPLRMEQMGQNAYDRASKLFNMENTVNNYLNMYEKASHFHRYSCV